MPRPVLFAFLVEMSLILLSAFLLTQPKMFFKSDLERRNFSVTVSGLVVLCITFCWSVILGAVLTIHDVSL